MGTPPLPYRLRPPQVLLGVGAVLVVTAAAAVASAWGGTGVRALVLLVGLAAAFASVRAARQGLRSAPEVLGASAAGLAVIATTPAGTALHGEPVTAALLAAAFLLPHLAAPATAAWPLAAYTAGQLAVLRLLDDLPAGTRAAAYLSVFLVGLGMALSARPHVARIAAVTSAPWWAAAVWTGTGTAWTDGGAAAWVGAGIVGCACAGLLVARLREALDPLLGRPRLVPVVAGVVSGVASVGPFSDLDPVAVAVTGFVGVLLATLPTSLLTGWPRGLLVPVTVAAGTVVTGLCVGRLAAAGRWSALALLLLLTAAPTLLVALRRAGERPVALPTTVACLGAAVLLALPDRWLAPVVAAALLTVLYAVAMVIGSALDAGARVATARAAALAAVAAVVLLVAEGDRTTLAVHLAVQGAFTSGWAWRTGAGGDAAALSTAAWRIGAAQLVAAAWVTAVAQDLQRIEWFTVSAAAGLLLGSGRRLGSDPTWRSWGPALVVAVVPSAVLAVVVPDPGRAVVTLVAAAGLMVLGGLAELRAPLEVGAATAVWIAAGLTLRTLPWPLATAIVVGGLLLAVGTRGERRPVAGFGARLADLR